MRHKSLAPPAETTKPKQAHRWAKGQSGNLAGRPKGSKHRALVALDAIGEHNAAKVLRVVVQQAIAGDLRAAEILLGRAWPPRRGRPVNITLPPIRTVFDLATALGAVADAVGRGEVTPEEAASVTTIFDALGRAIETGELARRVQALEAALSAAQGGSDAE